MSEENAQELVISDASELCKSVTVTNSMSEDAFYDLHYADLEAHYQAMELREIAYARHRQTSRRDW